MEKTATNGCVTDQETAFGYWWCYRHPAGETQKTLDTVVLLARGIASGEAHRDGKAYLVVLLHQPALAIYVFAHDHPDAQKYAANVIYELTPAGACLYRNIAEYH